MTETNKELELAHNYVEHTDIPIFLTGRAGTGKTTFLKNLKKNTAKRLMVVAPTGVAAINAAGVTLHSFFQLPFGPFLPDSGFDERNTYRFNKDKIKIIKSLDLLVIDEISMVRADTLDAVDHVLRRYRNSIKPFGGVQLLMIGDLLQLSPVVKESERPLLERYYKTPYFFSCLALSQLPYVCVELTTIYRQKDDNFIAILNRIRDGKQTTADIEHLNGRYDSEILKDTPEGCITLCTHNRRADDINHSKLRAIQSTSYTFDAETKGEFPEHASPAPIELELKKGCQVMFIRNDASEDKLFFNGKIGHISRIDNDEIHVFCPEDSSLITVEPALWEQIEYKLNEESGEIEEKKVGSFSQYPLKLAWAITIHKSQGLSFDRAIIDGEAAFAPGQIYVALSRLRSFEGLTLGSLLRKSSMTVDYRVRDFMSEFCNNDIATQRFHEESLRYEQKILMECFDFKKLYHSLQKLNSQLKSHASVIQVGGFCPDDQVIEKFYDEVFMVGENFRRQLMDLFAPDCLPSDDHHIQERCQKASTYFTEKFAQIFTGKIYETVITTDNKEVKKQITKTLTKCSEEFFIQEAAITSCKSQFSVTNYLRQTSAASLKSVKKKAQPKSNAPTFLEKDIEHPELFSRLRDWRKNRSDKDKLAPFQVMHQKVIIQLSIHLPRTATELLRLNGIGPKIVEKYGDEILELIAAYRAEKNIGEITLPKSSVTASSSKKDTKEATLELFNEGKSITEITKLRGLTTSTVEGHLAYLVENGRLALKCLNLGEKEHLIMNTLQHDKDLSLKEIKEKLGEQCSYAEIRFVQAHMRFKQKK